MIGFHILTTLVFLSLAAAAYWGAGIGLGKEPLTLRGATWRSALYVACAMAFGVYLDIAHGRDAGSRFFAGYAMEKALSVDNLMVFSLVLAHFQIPPAEQPKALRYGIVGAIVFRLVFVVLGAGSLALFGRPIEILMGAIVAWSACKMINAGGGDKPAFSQGGWLARKIPPSAVFWLCVVAIEATDVSFSFDSVPAVIAVTRDPYIVFPAMIFAILGLRSMYFVLEAARRFLVYLDRAVIAVLGFIAVKLMFGFRLAPEVSLAIVLGILSAGVLASLTKRSSVENQPS